VNLWGDASDVAALQAVADRHGIALFFDSAHAMGCRIGERPIGGHGALEVFSFHATKVFSSAEGGCITTNDDALAARLRNIRSSYGAGKPVDVVKTSNGRMSEAQAAIGLLNLDTLPQAIARNREVFLSYRDGLAGIPGVTLYEPQRVTHSNHQYIVCTIDAAAYGLSRDGLLQWLQAHRIIARRYFYPGTHRSVPYVDTLPQYVDALPVTDRLNDQLIQLPTGAQVSDDDVALICRLVAAAPRTAPDGPTPGA
jgi:dTDP-4-amino-4,6-dideoxygalactose transaminase